ncbi:MAG: NmrA/HSCARG family protein, partial [Alphaproteobacteria bacterium]
VRALRERGHDVIALTRNASSDRAAALTARGATVVAGDFTDPHALVRAAQGVDTVFIMSTPFEAGTDAETEQGVAAINAAKTAGVGHVVFSSVADANKNTGIPHFESKFKIEQHLSASGLPFTIMAPVYFMDNILGPWGGLSADKLTAALPAGRKLQHIAASNIGDFAASLIERRDSVFGKRFDIAGDELALDTVAAILTKIAGRDIGYEGFPADALRTQSEDLALMYEWFDRVGYSADIEALRTNFPEVKWLRYEDWATLQDWGGSAEKAVAE